MMKDNLHFDGKEKLQAGIEKIAQAVGVTMGTGGSNAIIEALESPGHIMTNDGYSIANSILLADPIEDMGRKILLESINRANKASGDGSSTTCVLTAAIIREGEKKESDVHPMEIKKQMEDCIPIIEASLKDQSKEIVKDGKIDVDLLKQVASISSEDEEIGATIAEIYNKIGPKGVIYWDVSKTAEDRYELGSGITVEGATYASPYMCDATESGQSTNSIRVKKPHILITKQKISSASDFDKIGAELNGKDYKDLIVFCDEFDPLVNNDLIRTRAIRGFRFILVKMPTLWKDWWYEDLAKISGATIVDPQGGLSMKDVTMEHLGRVGNILINKEDTFIDGIADISEHIKALEDEDTDDSKLRASRLNTKTARYFVGAHSESALSYRRLKVEDAIGAAYQALNGGIVPGGGVALFNASQYLPKTEGGIILRRALQSVIKKIAENAGISGPYRSVYKRTLLGRKIHKRELEEVWEKVGGMYGFDSRTKEVVDMFEAGIIDPKNVLLNSVNNAISVASTVITAPTMVLLPREEEPQQEVPTQPVIR